MASDEERHYEELRAIRQRNLAAIEEQIERFGAYSPPYLLVERAKLRQELGIVEKVLAAPAGTSEIGDELGETGRFLLYHESLRQLDKKVADLVGQFLSFTEDSKEWRDTMRGWLVWIGVAVFILSLLAVAVITYLAVRG